MRVFVGQNMLSFLFLGKKLICISIIQNSKLNATRKDMPIEMFIMKTKEKEKLKEKLDCEFMRFNLDDKDFDIFMVIVKFHCHSERNIMYK